MAILLSITICACYTCPLESRGTDPGFTSRHSRGAEGVRALGDLFRRDGLPSLKALHLSDNRLIRDEGVVALAGGLREAPRTMLSVLKLRNLGMGDEGMIGVCHRPRAHGTNGRSLSLRHS